MKNFSPFLVLATTAVALVAPLKAQDTTSTTVTTTTTTQTVASSARQAFDVAKDGVDAGLRSQVVSLYGTGTPAGIDTWYVIFYDPSVASHGRAVRVQNGQITKTYEAKGGVIYADTLTFDPARIGGEGTALTTAQNYAGQHNISYDRVRALLRVTQAHQNLRWRIQLLQNGRSRGFVFANLPDGSFAMYAPGGTSRHENESVEGDAQRAGRDIKNTFLGIGGDLQEFFTGDRTVDQ